MLIVILLIILIFIVAFKFGGDGDGPRTFYMGEVWFKHAKDGSKVADLRPGPLSKYIGLIGQKVVYNHKDQNLNAKIVHINHYDAWKEMGANDYKFIAPQLKSMADLEKVMLNYYKIGDTEGVCVLFFEAEGVKPSTPEAEAALEAAKNATPYQNSHASAASAASAAAPKKKDDSKQKDTKKADSKKKDTKTKAKTKK